MKQSVARIELDGGGIAVVLTQPDNHGDRCVVLVHGGPGGTKDGPAGLFVMLASRLASAGIASLRFDMLGVGDSDGDYATMTLASQAEQLGAVIQLAQRSGCGRLGLLGESLGAAVVLLGWPAGARAGALLWPAIDLMDTSLTAYLEPHYQHQLETDGFFLDDGARVGRAFVREFQRLRSLDGELGKVRAPVLLVHGLSDTDVPSRQSERASGLLPEPKRLVLVPDGQHGLDRPDQQRLVCDETTAWFAKHL